MHLVRENLIPWFGFASNALNVFFSSSLGSFVSSALIDECCFSDRFPLRALLARASSHDFEVGMVWGGFASPVGDESAVQRCLLVTCVERFRLKHRFGLSLLLFSSVWAKTSACGSLSSINSGITLKFVSSNDSDLNLEFSNLRAIASCRRLFPRSRLNAEYPIVTDEIASETHGFLAAARSFAMYSRLFCTSELICRASLVGDCGADQLWDRGRCADNCERLPVIEVSSLFELSVIFPPIPPKGGEPFGSGQLVLYVPLSTSALRGNSIGSLVYATPSVTKFSFIPTFPCSRLSWFLSMT